VPPETSPLSTAPVGTAPVGTAPVGTAPPGTAPLGTSPVGTPPTRAVPRRPLLVAGAVLVLVAASVLTWAVLRPDSPSRTPAAGVPSGATATATPADRTSAEATRSPQEGQRSRSAPPPQTPAAAAVPDGWTRRTEAGRFSLAIPDDWTVTRDGPGGRFVYFSDPVSDRYLLVDQTDTPKGDPVADWREQSANRGPKLADYHEIRIERVRYFLRAADWEFTYTHDEYGPVHVVNRGFVTSPDRGYALYWLTPADEWQSSRDEFAVFAETFRPAG
jgi:hypothetical protein